MLEDIKNIKSDKKELRKFGITVGVVFGLLGALLFWRGKDIYYFFLILCTILTVPAIVWPRILFPIQKAWMSLAIMMGWVMTRVILSILFYLVLTPTGVVMKIIGKDFMDMKFDKKKESYWIPKEESKQGKDRYENQF